MKKGFYIVATLVVILGVFVSCSTSVTTQYMVPSKVDMSDYRNLAIASVSPYPFRPFELPNPIVRDLSGTSPVRVYSGFTVNDERSMSEYLTNTIVANAYETGYFTVLTPSVTDAFVNRPSMLYDQGYDALLTVYTTNIDVEEFIYAQEKDVVVPNQDPSEEPQIETRLFHYLEQNMTVEFTYDLRDTHTGQLIDTDSYRKTSSTTTKLDEESGPILFAPSMSSTLTSIASSFGNSLVEQYVPQSVTRSFSLLKNSPKNRNAEKGYEAVKEGNLVDALSVFEKEWNRRTHIPSAYNAALIHEALGDRDEGIKLLEKAIKKTGNTKLRTLLQSMQERADMTKEAQKQL